MKKICLFTFLLLILAFQTTLVFSQTNKKAEIKRIDSYCKQIEAFAAKHKNSRLIFAAVSGYDAVQEKWRKFVSEKSLDAAETYNTAYVWRKNGRVVTANFTLSSPSGDWVHYIFHYFRADGSLAKVSSQLNTFYGNITVLRDFYFDRKGKLLRKTTRYLDLKTQKPKKSDEQNFNDNEVKIYKTTRKLPFARLLK